MRAPIPEGNAALQAIWGDPLPSFLAPVEGSRGTPTDGRSVVPAEPPRALGVPTARGNTTSTSDGGIPIRVFFSRHPNSDGSFSAVFPVPRAAPDRAVATAALMALIDGPTPSERAAGYFSEPGSSLNGPSSCSGRDFRLSIASGSATVRLCRMLTTGGVGQDARIRSQIEATLRQLPTIRATRLLGPSGRCLFDASGTDRCLAAAAAAPPPGGAGVR
jgi:hypothetical protein